jgi:alkaline phosphatase
MKLNLSTFTKTLTLAILTFSLAPTGLFAQETKAKTEITSKAKAKYVFYFIGDGMGTVHRSAAEFYQNNGAIPNGKKLKMNEFPYYGMSTTYSTNSAITDSAAAGTALATGYKTESGVINMDPGKKKKFTTLAEVAHDQGYQVGIITSVTINHATPAAFYAHQPSRGMYYQIADELSLSGFEYFGGGGAGELKSTAPPDSPSVFDLAKERGYTIVTTPEEFDALSSDAGKVWAIGKEGAALDYALDADEKDISLAEFTEKGIELLGDSENGFFIMIEGGKIDWASHANDPGAALNDVLAMDKAVKVAYKFYEEHPEDTLIVATADHETGGLTLGFAGTHYTSSPSKISNQKMSYGKFNEIVKKWKNEKPEFEKALPTILNSMGIKALSSFEKKQLEQAYNLSVFKTPLDDVDKEEKYLLYGSYEPVTVKAMHIATNQAGMFWSTYSHTGVPVPVTAIGPGAEDFTGYYDNTDIPKKIATLMGLTLPSMKATAEIK